MAKTVKEKAEAFGKVDYVATTLDIQIAERVKAYAETDYHVANEQTIKQEADASLKTFCVSILADLNKVKDDDSDIISDNLVEVDALVERLEDLITELS